MPVRPPSRSNTPRPPRATPEAPTDRSPPAARPAPRRTGDAFDGARRRFGELLGFRRDGAPAARPDPLAVDRSARGINFARVYPDPDLVAEALRQGEDVPGRVQSGPTCGLYALGMVMDHYDRMDSRNLNPLVLRDDTNRPGSHNAAPDTTKTLFDVARGKGFTTQGEMFTADQLGQLATEFGYRYSLHENATLADIKACIDRGHPALVAFDVDYEGNPGMYGGERAHWAVIEGHYQKDGVEYLVATHGWTGKEYVWRASDFLASFNQVNHSRFPAAPADITGTLKQRIVEVSPGTS